MSYGVELNREGYIMKCYAILGITWPPFVLYIKLLEYSEFCMFINNATLHVFICAYGYIMSFQFLRNV